MIKEIYCKLPTDLDYELKIEMEDEAKQILQQIKMVLGTKPGEVMGSPLFGIDIEKYLFKLNYSKDEIIQVINTELMTSIVYNPNKWSLSVDVLFGHNAEDAYEYACIDIKLNEQKCLGIIVNQQ